MHYYIDGQRMRGQCMFKIAQNKVMIQIGTNNGADEFNGIVKYSNPSKVILVEPNKKLNGQILKNYEGIRNFYLENVAITEVNKGKVTLVIPTIKRDKSGKNVNYIDVHYSLLPMDDWGDSFDEMEVLSMTFSELCEKHNVINIHYLQIDTEGYDAEIIKSIDFKHINIDIIKYEDWSFPVSSFSRYGDKAKYYGVNGMTDVAYLLKNLGYSLTEENKDFIAVKE